MMEIDTTLKTQAHALKPQTVEYFRSLQDVLDNQEDAEDRELLLANVFDEIKGEEEALLLNKHVSRTIERVFQLTEDRQMLKAFLWSIRENFFALCRGRCSSHPLQAVVARIPEILLSEGAASSGGLDEEAEELDEKDESVPSMGEILATLCGHLPENCVDLMFDPFASFLVRDLLRVLGGVTDLKPKQRKRAHGGSERAPEEKAFSLAHLPGSASQTVNDIAAQLCNSNGLDWESLAFDQHAGPAVQILLETLDSHDDTAMIESIIAKLLLWDFDEDLSDWSVSETSKSYVYSMMCDRVGSHLMQRVCQHASPRVTKMLIKAHFTPHLVELALHPCANYCVQAILQRISGTKVVRKVVKKLHDSMGKLFASNRVGVVWRLTEACARLKECQEELLKLICEAKSCEPQQLVESLLKHTAAVAYKQKSSYDWGGAMLLQALLKFDPKIAKPVFQGFLALSRDNVHSMCVDSIGSHVFGAFLHSHVHTNKKKVFINRLEGRFSSIARDKFGSFCIEKCLLVAAPKQKKKIASELSKSLRILSGSRIGCILITKFQLDEFSSDPEKWANGILQLEKKISKERREADSRNSNGPVVKGVHSKKEKKKQKKAKRKQDGEQEKRNKSVKKRKIK
eukprot:100371_1